MKNNKLMMSMVTLCLYFVLKRFTATPDFLLGILIGTSICFSLIGLLSIERYQRLKKWKRRVLGFGK
ncbi:hypothetical protein [Labilibaculum sp.]|uniref:hypothetical protein n=1 Tax=Labilibaculum sp. TaxID=2060723 RepID=UPI002AA62639|nr:hypothetical protein [Labilibaculum sp.]MBN2596312.1 hypothetical protein [Marinifilaceae bacterium]